MKEENIIEYKCLKRSKNCEHINKNKTSIFHYLGITVILILWWQKNLDKHYKEQNMNFMMIG